MDDLERKVLETQRADLLAKRAEIDVVLKWLNSTLGSPVDVDVQSTNGAASGSPVNVSGEVTSIIHEGEFYGLSATKASRALLERVGRVRPLKTAEIFDAIRKGGVVFKSKEGLYKSLDRDSLFHKVGAGRWGLAEWYPNATRDSRRGDSEDAQDAVNDEEPSAPDGSQN